SANAFRLRALGALSDFELYALRFFQRAVAIRVNCRVVHEDVGAAAVLGDEAVALLSVEPLDGSLCHCAVSFRGRCGMAVCQPCRAAMPRPTSCCTQLWPGSYVSELQLQQHQVWHVRDV